MVDMRAIIDYNRGMSRPTVHIRLPKGLREQLGALAVEQDVSFNGLVVALLSGAIGFNLVPDDEEPAPTDDAESAEPAEVGEGEP